MKSIGERIKTLRKERKMTLEQVGDIVGVGKSTVRKWENGMISNMRQDKIAKLAQALDVAPTYLMGWEEEPPEKEDATLSIEIGKRLTALRESKHLSLYEMAKEFDISVEDLKAYESGLKKIPNDLLSALKKYFGVNDIQFKNIDEKHLIASTDATYMSRVSKWGKEFSGIEFTDDEVTEIINFAKYVLSKRKDKQ